MIMLYYIHGYQSSPDSNKGTLFKERLNAKAIKYRDCEPEDLIITDCLKCITSEIETDDDVVLIGSSLGGLLAAKTALEHSNVKKLMLLNPAIIPPSVDINTIQGLPLRILVEMKDNRLFENKLDAEINILVGTKDDVIPVDWSVEFAIAQEASIHFLHDDHSFSYNLKRLPEIISKIIDIEAK